jgi:ATP-dependent DNA ligase
MPLLYYFPNRPILIPPDPTNPLDPKPDYLNSLEQSGKYIAERKWNGDNCYIYTYQNHYEFWNRHKDRLSYQPSPEVLAELDQLPKNCILNVECVNSRTKTIKHYLVAHCLMAFDGKPLLGKTWGDSRKILETWTWGQHVVLSEIFTKNFWDHFNEADVTTVEGIVLKDPTGRLVHSTTPIKDVSYMLKVRKPCKKYQY